MSSSLLKVFVLRVCLVTHITFDSLALRLYGRDKRLGSFEDAVLLEMSRMAEAHLLGGLNTLRIVKEICLN